MMPARMARHRAEADIVVIGAPHAEYRGLDFGERRVVDIWGLGERGIQL